jgi:glycosyltransferase involved in cell wall biosynthesis
VRTHERFSLLLAVHAGDRVDFVRQAFRSAVDDQTLPPDQVVLVRDGPVPPPLAECLDALCASSPVPVTLVPLEHNAGLGPALDAGLAASPYDVIARMDADDVAMPQRFAVQLPLISAGADIVGAGLLEFGRDTDDIVGRRTPPSDPEQIARYARLHDPFNHPTVVYRRQAVLGAGGYGDLPLMEDYWLFARMLANGARAINVVEPLVYYRVGAGAYKRRGGTRLLRSELALQRRLREQGFTSRTQYARNVLVRGGYRLFPAWFRRLVYRRVVANYGERRGRAVPAIPSVPAGESVSPGPPGESVSPGPAASRSAPTAQRPNHHQP